MYKIADAFIVEAVSEVVKLLGMVTVMVEHVLKKRQSLFRRRSSRMRMGVAVRMRRPVRMGVGVAVAAVLVLVSMLVVVLMRFMLVVMYVIIAHFYPPFLQIVQSV